ncbi:sensor histidine kinase [Diaphorobacter aerolatus]|uniref:Histidine kinase n=1 Tax=Diaphorobacter aerolatus TaxID=1288495 RepID=A0A7H0GIK2_9BURK|nr:histidine kinase [Diaphorobacter aerolatus]QNP48118.1 histidine kinase [Diaphorobacter aerolatus]
MPTHTITLPQLARHAAATLFVCLLITLVLTLAGMSSWDVNLVYSVSIGVLSWLTIEFARFRLSNNHSEHAWPHGWRGVAVVALGIAIGVGVGGWIGDSYQTLMHPQAARDNVSLLVLPVVITIAASATLSFVFYLIGKSRHFQMQAAQAERQTAQAQLQVLQAQLEPHMLFNTLANLRALVATQPERAEIMLDHLIDYLRATLTHSRQQEHTLRDEFARLRDYLEIMQIRMGQRLTFTLDLPDALAEVRVPPLLLQPLVENSIRHGLEPQIHGGAVRVSARPVDDGGRCHGVELCISDTGPEFNPSPLEASDARSGKHLGTALVRERLATRYGDRARFELRPATQGTGMIACIVIPIDPSA